MTAVKRAIRLPEVKRKTGKGRSWIYEAVKKGQLPPPFKLGGSSCWFEHEVDAALERAAAASRGGVESA